MNWRIKWLRISPENIPAILEEINYGSEPAGRYYALVATSALIATFGLIANSVAVIIGAMVVAPLMTPIFGLALALVRSDTKLLGRALQALTVGVVVAVGVSALFGSLPLALQITPEMLARTQPNLLDLLVAVLAGFAGAYAMIDVRLSPTLPGVAIAVAVVPPLANTGLCLAMGAYMGMSGSFLLFLANALSILLVSAGMFLAAGLGRRIELESGWQLMHRFGWAGLGFILVAGILTHALVRIVTERDLTNAIRAEISAEFARIPASTLVSVIHRNYDDKLYILATIRAPKITSPERVKLIQERLSKKLHRSTELIVRTIMARDVSATGSTSQVTAQNLNGFFLRGKLPPDVLTVQQAEQSLRETLSSRPELTLMDVNLLHFPSGPAILATIQGPRVLIPSEVRSIEQTLRQRLHNPKLGLLVRSLITVDVDGHGRVLYGEAHFGAATPAEKAQQKKVEVAVREEFKNFPELILTNVDAIWKNQKWHIRVEAVGARVPGRRDVIAMEDAVSRSVKQPVKIYLWSRAEAMVTSEGLTSLENYTEKRLNKPDPR
jgi:uncharacterized hydrophobic protein (TIGR00271 family)